MVDGHCDVTSPPSAWSPPPADRGSRLMLGASNNLLSRSAVGSSYSRHSGGQSARVLGQSSVRLMRQLSAVPWLSSDGRALSILCVATLVCGAFGLLKISIGEKQAPNKELTTGSIQRSPAVRKPESRDPMAAFLTPAVAQSMQRSTKSTTADLSPIPLPRPRPKRP
jgi:hypothetical protein